VAVNVLNKLSCGQPTDNGPTAW